MSEEGLGGRGEDGKGEEHKAKKEQSEKEPSMLGRMHLPPPSHPCMHSLLLLTLKVPPHHSCRVCLPAGIGDSVGFAIRLEDRYKGVRGPHKVKGGVSGCIRECAEAQSKDFGLIAVQGGYNVYVCGNGGSKPRHATLLAASVDEATAQLYLDRFMMYYLLTASKLQRTARWLEAMEGGIEHLKEVVIDDKLGICDELERRMQSLVNTYECEWKAVVEGEI
eukprot:SAG22_NODE_147_length_17533_cov_46.384536_9_plen_221_part_00